MMIDSQIAEIAAAALNSDKILVQRLVAKLARSYEMQGDKELAKELLGRVSFSQKSYGLQRAVIEEPSIKEGAKSLPVQSFELPKDKEDGSLLADIQMPTTGYKKPILNSNHRDLIKEFLAFVKNSKKLKKAGLEMTPSMLLYGPPGCGKTLAAGYIANELDLPLITARCDTLVSSYLGSTAKNIRQLFDHVKSSPCILFLDEFDALAKARDDQHELGELKRVVVALLQNIDALPSNTVLLAATNHEELLDRAVWRRFEYRLEIGFPDFEARRELIERLLSNYVDGMGVAEDFAVVSEGLSCAQIEQTCQSVLRTTVLNNQKILNSKFLLQRLLDTTGWDKGSSKDIDAEIVKFLRKRNPKLFTFRRVAKLIDVSLAKVQRLSK